MRVSGYKIQQDLSEDHSFAKTVTSLLTLPSVLAEALILKHKFSHDDNKENQCD